MNLWKTKVSVRIRIIFLDPDLYSNQMIRIWILQKPLKTENTSQLRTEILFFTDLICTIFLIEILFLTTKPPPPPCARP